MNESMPQPNMPDAKANREVRVFVSSTFRDMHAERDHLVTVVFPELRERIEQLGLEFFDVDLRWGVPEKDVNGETANSWEYCRQWIERVEPLFVCILGQRYGWVPGVNDFKDEADKARQASEPRSITDLEVRHAVLNDRRKRRSFFYLRAASVPAPDPSDDAAVKLAAEYVDSPALQDRLEKLKTDVRECGRPVRDYPCRWTGDGFADMEEFGQYVLEDLWSGVLRDERYVADDIWRTVLDSDPDSDSRYTDESQPVPRELWEQIVATAKPEPKEPLDAERQQMDVFAVSRLKWFQGREKEIKQLTAFVQSTDKNAPRLAVVAAGPGQGKSALIAKLSTLILQPSTLLITHFVGATERSASAYSLVERLLGELDRSGITWPTEEHAEAGQQPKRDFHSLCRRLDQCLGDYAGERGIVILLDALNQLSDGHDLQWLPRRLGSSVHVIVSCVDDPNTKEDSPEWKVLHSLCSRQRAPLGVPLGALTEADARSIVVAYLREYCKELDPKFVTAICRMPQAHNPLYLQVMLGELRTLGGNDMSEVVPELIASMPANCPDTVSLFRWVLQRLEVFGQEEVKWWNLYLAHGRVGMSSHELADLLAHKCGPDAAATALRIERGLRRYLHRRGSQLDFFHGQLRQAVFEQYGPEAEVASVHAGIAVYFHDQDDFLESLVEQRARDCRRPPTPRLANRRKVEELPWQRLHAKHWDELGTLLGDLSFLEAKVEAGQTYDLVLDYRLVEEHPESPDSLLRNTAPFAKFVMQKAALFASHPCLVFQEAANQPAGSPVAVAAFGRRTADVYQRRWIEWANRDSIRAKLDFSKGIVSAWPGRLPLLTGPDDRKAWMMDREGRLVEVEIATGQSHLVWETICPAPQYLMMLGWRRGPRLVLLGIAGDWIVGDVGSVRPNYCTSLDLGGGRIAACQRCPEGILLIVGYPSHEPARLMLVGVGSDGSPVRGGTTVELEFGWKPRTGLSVLESQGLAACPYGPRVRECALIDYRNGTILRKYAGHKTFIEVCCAVEERDLLVTGSQDGEILMFRLSTGEVIARIEPGWEQVLAIVWSARHSCLIAAGTGPARDETYLVWNLHEGGPPKQTRFPGSAFDSVVLSAEEHFVFSGSLPFHPFGGIGDSHRDHDAVIVRDIADLMPTTGETHRDEPEPLHHNSVVLEIHPLPDRERAVTTSLFGEIWVWDLASGRPSIRRHPEALGTIQGSVVSDDGQWMAIASVNATVEWEDGRPTVTDWRRVVTLWNLASDLIEPAWRTEDEIGPPCPFGHDELIRTALGYFGRMVFEGGIGPHEATSPDGVSMFSAGASGLFVYEAATRREVAWFEMPRRIAVVCAVDKDYALVGDVMGYVWALRLRHTANVMESEDTLDG